MRALLWRRAASPPFFCGECTAWTKTLAFIVVSPFIGLLIGYFLMIAIYWLLRYMPPAGLISGSVGYSSCPRRFSA